MNYANAFLMATELYGFRSQLEMVNAFSSLIFSVALLYFWGIYGAIAGLGFALIVGVISVRKVWQHVAFKIEWHTLFDLIVTGLPIMVNGMLRTAMSTIDKILIAALLSRDELGIYGVGAMGVTILGTIPSGIGQILFVKFG